MASTSLTRASGSAAWRIACHEKARITIAPHMIASPSRTKLGLELIRALVMLSRPILLSARTASRIPPSDTAASPNRRTSATAGW